MAYVYRHIRLDKNVPFYIGIGANDEYKRAFSKTGRNPIWKRIVAKTDFEVEIIIDDVSVREAKDKEIEFINLYGRLSLHNGTLSNITGGGDGFFDPPKEHRLKIIKRNKGNVYHKGKSHTDEAKIIIGQYSSKRNKGEKNPAFKGMVEAFKNGAFIGLYESANKCAENLHISNGGISQFFSGKRKSVSGFTFKRIAA